MGNQRFICEVKRDFDNNTLGLVHTNDTILNLAQKV